MARQGLQGRARKPGRCLTRADAQAEELPDLLRTGCHRRGGSTRGGSVIPGQIDADEGCGVSSLPSRGPVLPADGSASPRSDRHPTAELATAAT